MNPIITLREFFSNQIAILLKKQYNNSHINSRQAFRRLDKGVGTMSVEAVRDYLQSFDLDSQILTLDQSSATVELASKALGVIPAQIAKTLSFQAAQGCLLVVTAGDRKIDNAKFKSAFGCKAKMLSPDQVLELTGHPVGGVCPFALASDNAQVYLDESLRRFEVVYPACGSSNTAIKLTIEQLFITSNAKGWVDVCKEI